MQTRSFIASNVNTANHNNVFLAQLAVQGKVLLELSYLDFPVQGKTGRIP